MKRATLIVAIVTLAATSSTPVPAADPIEHGVYLGGSVGQSGFDFDRSVEDVRIDGSDTGYKLFLGLRFFDFLAVEGGYVDFGSDSERFGELGVSTEVSAWHGFVLGILPLGSVDLFVKGGLARWDGEVDLALGGARVRATDSGTGEAFGAGLAVRFGKLALRAEYERFDVSDIGDLELASIGLTYTF